MLYHCLTLLLLSFFLHLSPLFLCLFVPSIILFQLVCLFVPSIILFQLVFNFKFLSFYISSFYTMHLCVCLLGDFWAVDWLKKSLCSLWLLLSASILSKNNEIDKLIPINNLCRFKEDNLEIPQDRMER